MKETTGAEICTESRTQMTLKDEHVHSSRKKSDWQKA